MRTTRLLTMAAAVAALATAVTACGGTPTQSSSTTKISFSDASCGGRWQAPAPGWHTFEITSDASAGAEVDLINPANGAVYDELEGDGPGTTTTMSLNLGSGQYAFLCMINEVDPFTGPTVTVSGHARGAPAIAPVTYNDLIPISKDDHEVTAAGISALVRTTAALDSDVRGGNLARAKSDWLTAHLAYETLGVAYSSFGDYDGEINGNDDSSGTDSPDWTGFYRLEYGLWHGQSASELAPVASTLDKNVRQLQAWWATQQIIPLDMVLRTHEILENALQFQLSGHDDYGSGTTAATTLANIAATRELLSLLRPLLVTRYQRLPSVYTDLSRLQSLLAAQDHGGTWTPVSALPVATRDQIDAAAEQTVADLSPIASIAEPRHTAHEY
jgi:iron uptake system component EfeO